MKYILKEPSLQQIAEVKIVSELFNQEEIKTEIDEEIARLGWLKDENKVFENNLIANTTLKNKIIEKLSTLPIPEPLKKNLVNWINPLTLGIRKWWFLHNDLLLKMPNKLCWTPRGTIDHRKTAELIVQDENVDIAARYKMACSYCLVNEISILWQRIPEMSKELFYYFEYSYNKWNPKIFRKELVTFWTYYKNNKITELHALFQKSLGWSQNWDTSLYQFAFKRAAFGLNPSATEFFFKKLCCEDWNLVGCCYQLLATRSYDYHGYQLETLFYMLNQMSEEEQERVFEKRVVDVLEGMLHWPYQTLFMKTARKWLRYLFAPGKDYRYFRLLDAICNEIKRDEKDYDYKKLFLEFWQLGLANCHNLFQKNNIRWNLIQLFEAKENELVKNVLNQATDIQKEQLLYDRGYSFDLSLIIYEEQWDFLQFLIGECITRKDIIINLKRNLKSRLSATEFARFKVDITKAIQIVDAIILKWE